MEVFGMKKADMTWRVGENENKYLKTEEGFCDHYAERIMLAKLQHVVHEGFIPVLSFKVKKLILDWTLTIEEEIFGLDFIYDAICSC